MMILHENQKIDACYTQYSLIGVMGNPPFDHGNYFWFNEGRCINMWLENMEALINDGTLDDKKIKVDIWEDRKKENRGSRYVVVVDERIPKEYINNSPCFTGYFSPKPSWIEEWANLYSWDQWEIKKYTNPKEYYEALGGNYNEETGLITFPVNQSSKQLKQGWSIDIQDDIKNEDLS